MAVCARFLSAHRPATTEVIVPLLASVLAILLNGMDHVATLPSAIHRVAMEAIALLLVSAPVTPLDGAVRGVRFLSVRHCAITVATALRQVSAHVIPLDGMDHVAILPSAIHRVAMVVIAQHPLPAFVLQHGRVLDVIQVRTESPARTSEETSSSIEKEGSD